MSALIKRIKELISLLPEKDVIIGNKLLEERDFDALLELVTSAIYKIKKKQNNEDGINHLENLLPELSRLKAEIDVYKLYSDVSDFSNDYDEEYESEINEY